MEISLTSTFNKNDLFFSPNCRCSLSVTVVRCLHRIKCSLNLILTAIFHVILPAHYNISSAVMEKAHEETKIIGETKN